VKLTLTLSVSLLPPHERVVEHACRTYFGALFRVGWIVKR
jgi:hypothetical protein